MNQEIPYQTDQIKPANSQVEIIELTAVPYGDHRRVKINFRLSLFQDPPNAAISLFGVEGEELASVNVVNIFQPENEVTLHIPKSRAMKGEYRVKLTLFELEERKAREDEAGEVRLMTNTLSSRDITFTLA